MSLGILIAAIFICQANDAYYDFKRNVEFYNKTEVYSLIPEYYENTGRIQKKDYPDIQNEFKEIQDIVCVNRINENHIQSKNQFITGLNVYTMSKNMDSLLKIEDYIQGEWLDHNEDCLIGDKVRKKYNIQLGDFLDIGLNRYQVVGVIDKSEYETSICILEDSIEALEFYDCRYYFTVREGLIAPIEKMTQYINTKYGYYKLQNHSDLIESERSRLVNGWGISIGIACLAMLYGILNITSIESFFLEQERKKIAIMLAFGGTKGKIIFYQLTKTSLYSFVSVITVSLMIYFIQKLKFITIIDLRFDIVSFIIIWFLSQSSAIFISYQKLRKLLKLEVVDIFKGYNT